MKKKPSILPKGQCLDDAGGQQLSECLLSGIAISRVCATKEFQSAMIEARTITVGLVSGEVTKLLSNRYKTGHFSFFGVIKVANLT